MKKRVCENCRFFQEAGFAKNGWCNNPQRKESNDMKLVVRRNELACRGSWSNDLFVPRTGDGQTSDIVLHDSTAQPVPPARAEEVTFLVSGHREKSVSVNNFVSPQPVDVMVGQMPSTNPAADRAPLLNHDNRSAILKARERHRARKATDQRHVEPILLKGSVVDDIDVAAPAYQHSSDRTPIAPYSPRPRRTDEVPPVQRSEIPRDFPTMTSFPEDDAKFMSVPEPVAGFELPRRSAPTPVESLVASNDDFDDDELVDHDVASYATTSYFENQRTDTVATHRQEIEVVEDRRAQRQFDEDPELPTYATEYDDADEYGPIDEVVPIFRQERRRFDFGGWRRPARVQHSPVTLELDEVEDEVDEWIEEPIAPVVEDRQVLAEFEPYPEVVEDIIIAPDVPRMCRTCRDFRPADSGERGWCTNQWAFSHRRMVDSDELPCETTVGVWWLPKDDVWLATADLSSHSQPTPLVDLWLGRNGQDNTESTGERRRKRS